LRYKILYKIFFCVLLVFFIVPYATNFLFKKKSKNSYAQQEIYLDGESILENYIKGVVAAEMPASFELEALKAQAVAARTYTLNKYHGGDLRNLYQAYINLDDMKKKWGDNFKINYKKISDAVDSTRGEVIKYQDKIIEAVFHSMSSGATENSENVWKKSLPYLKSVDSQEDHNAPNFISKKIIPVQELVNKLNEKYNTKLTQENFLENFIIQERTPAGYIKKIFINQKEIDPLELRMFLGLRSTNFTIEQNQKEIIFITKGYGHGAGMSQYGANFMAKAGCDYKKILKHYYSGVEIN